MKTDDNNLFSMLEIFFFKCQRIDQITDDNLLDLYQVTIKDIIKFLTNYNWKFEHFILPNQLERIVFGCVGPSFKNWYYENTYKTRYKNRRSLPFPEYNLTIYEDDIVYDCPYDITHLKK